MKFKRILSLLSSAAMAVTAMTGAMTVSASTMNDVFTAIFYGGQLEYAINGYSDNYIQVLQELDTTEVTVPKEFDDGSNGKYPVINFSAKPSSADNYITKITLGDNISGVSNGTFVNYQALKTIVFEYSGLDFSIPNNFASARSGGASDCIKEIYIYAQTVTVANPNAFTGINENLKIYVANDDVKKTIVDTTSTGSYAISDEQVIVMESSLPASEFTITCEDIYYGTEGGFKPVPSITQGDGDISYTLYNNEACTEQASSKYNANNIAKGTYYIRGAMAETENYAASFSNVVKVEVKAHVVGQEAIDALNNAIKAAEEFQSTHNIADYDEDAWNNIFQNNTNGLLRQAKDIAFEVNDGRYSEEEVIAATEALNSAISGLVRKGPDYSELDPLIAQAEDIINNHADEYWGTAALESALYNAQQVRANPEASQEDVNRSITNLKNAIASLQKVDTQAEFEALQKAIENAESLDAKDYTDESYAALAEAIEAGKAFTAESDAREMRAAARAITNAVSKLVLKPLEPIVYVYKKGKTANVLNGIADEALAGAKTIKLTFDCASDVDFNSNATIEVKALVNGVESYQRINGNKGQASGETNCEVTLPLTNAIEAGNEFEITAFTYAWDNASDYVYAITKIEFIDDSGKVVGKVTAKTVAKDELAKAIADAEAIDADKYTEDSYAELTKAIEAAKALTEDATAAEMNAAIDAINAAIKALVEKQAPTEPTTPSNTTVTTTATKTPVKTTRSADVVKKDKTAAHKAMKQAKITKLTVKSKAKKKVAVSWKKVKKAKGYQVQVSAKKNFKKVIFKKFTTKNKLTIKNSKIKSKKTYFVRVRAYATYNDKNGKAIKVYSKWNKKLRKVTVK